MPTYSDEFDVFVEQRLRELGLSKSEMMRTAELSRTVYYKLASGQTEQARVGTILKLAYALKVHPFFLFRRIIKDLEPLSHSEPTLYKCDATGFVRDVTIPDNTLVTAGQVFEKVWEIQNLGVVPWFGRRLVCVDAPVNTTIASEVMPPRDYTLLPAEQSIAIPDTLPEERVMLAMTFTAPVFPCSVLSYWKMVDKEGRLCFPANQGLYCQVQVLGI